VQDTTDPVLSGVPGDVTVECDAVPVAATPTAEDNCDDDVSISYGETRADGDCADNYVLTRTWTATDNCGNTDVEVQRIKVQDTTDPVLSGVPEDVTVECDAVPVAATPTAEDNCDDDVSISYSETRADGDCADNYLLTRTWTATDNCGNTDVGVQRIKVQDTTDPVLSGVPEDVTVECDAVPVAATPTAEDNCDDDVSISYGETRADGDCADNYVLTRTWTATDNCGNSTSERQTIKVQDTTDPVLSGVPADVTVECDDVPDAALPTAEDNCDISVEITYAEVRTDGDCINNYVLTRTWTATDNCGNTDVETQVITVEDSQAPTIVCPEDITANADKFFCEKANVEIGIPESFDNCDEPRTIEGVRDDGLALEDPYPVGTTKITWTVTGECSGLSSSCMQFVTIVDSQPPTIVCKKINVALNDDGGLVQIPDEFFYDGAFDNCTDDEAVLNTITVERNVFSCLDMPSVLVQVCATDDAGNVGCCFTTVKVQDNFAPTAVCQDVTVALENGVAQIVPEEIDGGSFDNADECGLTLAISSDEFTDPGVYDVTLSVTDIGENVTTCVSSVTVTGIPAASGLQISSKIWLEGSMNTTQTGMISKLDDVIPLVHPYSPIYGYGGTEALTQVPAGMIDWVMIQLRDPNNPTVILSERAALLMESGFVVDLDGQTPVDFGDMSDGMYYVSVLHRNHLAVISNTSIEVSNGLGVHDFTAGNAMGVESVKQLTSGQYALWCGDLNADGVIDASDRSIAWNMRNTVGYVQADANMDGVVDASERSITWNNRNKASGLPQ
jgi:hypothetical protein